MKISLRNIRVLIILTALSMVMNASAQTLTDGERQQGLEQLRAFKHKMFEKELSLTKEQKDKFFNVYDAMDDELMEIGNETRDAEKDINADASASDQELREKSRVLFEQKKREGEVELKYYDRLAEVLTPRQLAKVKGVERKITMSLARYHAQRRPTKK